MMRGPFSIIEVPYNLGLEGVGVGAGPRKLLEAGVDEILSYHGMPAQVDHVRMRDMRSKGLDAVVDVNRLVRSEVMTAIEQQSVPVILAGNCITAVGVLGAMEGNIGVVWLDRHPDFHTPATSRSGNVEGMSVACLAGDCHDDLRLRSGLAVPISHHRICVPFSWDAEPGERERLDASAISGEYPLGVDAVYLHIDVDVAGAGGDNVEKACSVIRTVCAELPVAAIVVANYNPEVDEDWSGLESALRLVKAIVE